MPSVEQFFDDYAFDFDALYGTRNSLLNRVLNPIFRRSMRVRFERTLISCQPLEDRTVLDVGCGPGHYAIALSKAGARRVVGIDFSSAMIKIASANANAAGTADRCEFLHHDIYDYESHDTFDYVVVMGVMDYIDAPEQFIEKILNLASRKALFSFPVSAGLLAFQRRLRYRNRCQLFMYTRDRLLQLFRSYDREEYSIEQIARDYFVTVDLERS